MVVLFTRVSAREQQIHEANVHTDPITFFAFSKATCQWTCMCKINLLFLLAISTEQALPTARKLFHEVLSLLFGSLLAQHFCKHSLDHFFNLFFLISIAFQILWRRSEDFDEKNSSAIFVTNMAGFPSEKSREFAVFLQLCKCSIRQVFDVIRPWSQRDWRCWYSEVFQGIRAIHLQKFLDILIIRRD